MDADHDQTDDQCRKCNSFCLEEKKDSEDGDTYKVCEKCGLAQ